MRGKNIGDHRLGCRGYPGKEPIWAKEDEQFISQGVENPYDKYPNPESKKFIRSRYHKEKETGELVTDPKVVKDVAFVTDEKTKAVEKALVRNLPA
jgi:hypothetical protein